MVIQKSCFHRTNKNKTNRTTNEVFQKILWLFFTSDISVKTSSSHSLLVFASQKLVLFLRRTTTTIVPHTSVRACVRVCVPFVRACVCEFFNAASLPSLTFASPSSLLHFNSNEDWQRWKRVGKFSRTAAFRRRKEKWMLVCFAVANSASKKQIRKVEVRVKTEKETFGCCEWKEHQKRSARVRKKQQNREK